MIYHNIRNSHNLKNQKGFTLIELLVVIAIIGILATIILVSLGDVRAAARDSRRAADAKALKTALELYFSDNGQYPSIAADNSGAPASNLAASLAPYLAQIPTEPSVAVSGSSYSYVRGPAANNSYGLKMYLEVGRSGYAPGTCKTGVNVNSGWWGVGVGSCPF